MTKPLAKIRVYPEERSLYVTCYVWPNKRAMRRETSRLNGGASMAGAGAACFTYRRERVGIDGSCSRLSPQFGEIHFSRTQLGSETITHELTHALLGWARRVGWKPDDDMDREERFCYAMGAMVRQLVNRLYARGLLQ